MLYPYSMPCPIIRNQILADLLVYNTIPLWSSFSNPSYMYPNFPGRPNVTLNHSPSGTHGMDSNLCGDIEITGVADIHLHYSPFAYSICAIFSSGTVIIPKSLCRLQNLVWRIWKRQQMGKAVLQCADHCKKRFSRVPKIAVYQSPMNSQTW